MSDRPGDFLLNRYFPGADEATRERAREAFRAFALLLLRIGERIAIDEALSPDSPELAGRPKIESPKV